MPARLPRRQVQVLNALLGGESEKEIAFRLGISPNTVHVYVKALYRRHNVSSRAELMSLWVSARPVRSGHGIALLA